MTIDPKYHPVVSQIIGLLTESRFEFETFEHQPVRTSEEAAKIRTGYSLGQGAKAIIVRVKLGGPNKKFTMLVIPGDMRFDKLKIKHVLGAKDIRFATEEEVLHLTNGILPGGIPPFGNLFGLEVVVDPALLTNEKIIFNAGDRSFSIAMKPADYVTLVKPFVKNIV